MARILIIDDDFSIVTLITEILKREGHETDFSREAVEGMQKARAMNPDLIILDYHMPGATGAHLFESLRRNEASKKTPILFLSGETTPEQILKEISDPEGSDFLAKPVHIDDFRRAVRQLLGQGPGGPQEPPRG